MKLRRAEVNPNVQGNSVNSTYAFEKQLHLREKESMAATFKCSVSICALVLDEYKF